jgi:hypothetical protein
MVQRIFFLENTGELHFIVLRRKRDKIPVTTHTTPQILDYIHTCNKGKNDHTN